MLVFNLSMDLDDDAFGDCAESRRAEIARILRVTAEKLEDNDFFACHPENLMDHNGNTVGHCIIEKARHL